MKIKSFLTFSIILVLISCNLFAARPAKPTGTILFIDTPSADKHYLASINPDGTGKKRLTPAFNNIMFPRHNEASGWIGFTSKAKDMTSEIYLLNKSGEKLKKVLTGAAFEDFSPDGKFFLYTTCDGKAELFVYSLERKRANKISQDLKVTAASWSPDGSWIAVSALTSDGTSDLYLISTMAQGIKQLTATKGVNEAFPVFSKDGKYLAYFSNRHNENEIEYMAIDKSSLQRPILRGIYPALSPDNQWVTFQEGNTIAIATIEGLDHKTVVRGRTPFWIK